MYNRERLSRSYADTNALDNSLPASFHVHLQTSSTAGMKSILLDEPKYLHRRTIFPSSNSVE